MGYLYAIRSLFMIPAGNPELTRSQLEAFSKHFPLLYFILVASTLGLAATHFETAPAPLTILAPAILCAAFLIRVTTRRRARDEVVTNEEAVRRLRSTIQNAALIGFAFTAWALSLYPYGNAYAQAHVAFCIAITVIGCIFCLMHLRAAALAVALIVVVPSAVFFALSGQPVFVAMSITMVLTAVAMTIMLFSYYKDFATLIESRKELIARQAETQRLSDENFRLANLDSLTNLPNRRRFVAELHARLHQTARNGSFAVGMIDLDGFKQVNDVFGHAVGDRVLVEVCRRLRQTSSPAVSLGRLGGDEFGLIVDHKFDAEIPELGRQLCEALRAPYVMPGMTATIAGSIGFAIYPAAGRSVAQLFERADYALHHAKHHRRGCAVVFSAEHETQMRESNGVEQALRHADLERELSLAFHPIVDVEARRTVAFEALARWNSPTLGRVAPSVFIKVAERSDLMNQLTEVLLRKALATAEAWPPEMRVSFNLSMRDITSPESILRTTAVVGSSAIHPGRIDLEVTETAVLAEFEQARTALLALKALGVNLSLDDFGTGYSSLSYVHRLPFDKIKIDRSFVTEIATDTVCRSIVRTVVDLCRNLGHHCVVEGVETAEQLQILQELGCTTMQGHYFGRPMTAADVLIHLAKERHLFAAPWERRRLKA
jgi:diguanylate cyclase (GGDEF)-like protein